MRPNPGIRSIARVLGILAAILPFSSCYLLSQGASLFRYQAAAEPVDDLLASGTTSDGRPLSEDTRGFLAEVGRISAFAQTLGLSASSSYTSFVPTGREYLVDVVNAAGAVSFERKMWWWPFVGKLPYKGYYRRDDAMRLAARLERKGLDVWVRRVDAFSTLGILDDPLYEFMRRYDRHTMANLIIHERAHATLFLRGHAQFNEEFATFVGDTGADLYLQFSQASDEELALLEDRAADRQTIRLQILELRAELEELYRGHATADQKLEAKNRTILAFKQRLSTDYEEMFRTEVYRGYSELPINNAFIDLFSSYTEDLELFAELYSATGEDPAAFLERLSVLADPGQIDERSHRRLARRDPKEFIRRVLLDSSDPASVE